MSVRDLIQGLQHSLFGSQEIVNRLQLSSQSTRPRTTFYTTRISELRLVVDGYFWAQAAEDEFVSESRTVFEREEDGYYGVYGMPLPEQTPEEEEDELQNEWYNRMSGEEKTFWYKQVLPSYFNYGLAQYPEQFLDAIAQGQISKCIILLQTINYSQKCIMLGLEEFCQKHWDSRGHRKVTMVTNWEPEDPDEPWKFGHNGSITFER